MLESVYFSGENMRISIRKIIALFYITIFAVIGLSLNNTTHAKTFADSNGSFWVKYIDVGQGDSTIIQCDGHYLMIDGGPSSASSIVYTILKNNGIKNIDYMIATHPDADHIGGLSGALNYASVGICYSPVTSHDTKTFNSLVKYLNKQGISLTVPANGTTFYLGNAKVELIGPLSTYVDSNNSSIVTKITYGSNKFLFTGDAEIEEENSLINAKTDLSCDVLKVGHHGSMGSSGDAFLKKAKPRYAVISVGTDNSYGHPAAETLSRLSNLNVELFRTDLQGDILCSSDGKNIVFTTEKKASADVLWSAGADSTATTTRNGVVVAAPDKAEIPSGTTFVLNNNTKKFHLTTCGSVNEMKASNRSYSSDSAETLIAKGYKPCGNCKPYIGSSTSKVVQDSTNESDISKKETDIKESNQGRSGKAYVLNTNTKKFHYPECSSVSAMSSKNRKDVTISREEIIAQGYVPCKRCNP